MARGAQARRAALARWRRDMDALGLDDRGGAAGRALIARHDKPWRRYHALGHLDFLSGEIERHHALIAEPARLVLAAWFHDAIYNSLRKDNEARSAGLAARVLPGLGASEQLTARVCALIHATADHASGGADADDALFLDMDCAILGAPPAVYDRYARQIRFEYGWAPSGLYRRGRRAFLTDQLARPRLFHTDEYEGEFGEQARANLARELEGL
ncbi:MAG: hypothetical protein JJU18_12310 [Oceanicaulis sp.]|nr:hypothetical protein [Oceanicaulis sp.]